MNFIHFTSGLESKVTESWSQVVETQLLILVQEGKNIRTMPFAPSQSGNRDDEDPQLVSLANQTQLLLMYLDMYSAIQSGDYFVISS